VKAWWLLVLAAGCSRAPTFADDVAPLIHRRCVPCHHSGGAGPFPLVKFEDVAPRAKQIARVTASRFMPPWKAARGVDYLGDRSLGDAEIALIQKWAQAGAPRGRGRAPEPPPITDGWQLGTPDVVLRLDQPYTLPAEGRDVYRNFVIANPFGERRFVAAWELRSSSRTVHHAILNLDANGWARRRDAEDPEPGWSGMDPGNIQAPDGFYLVWTPGQAPIAPAEGMSWPLEPRTDLVLQLHLQPSGKPETLLPEIALYFAPAPPTVLRATLRIGDPPLDIPAGDAQYLIRDRFVLPADAEVLSLFPHAHYLAHDVRVWAELPDGLGGKTLPLLHIADWDPAWQQDYVLKTPLALPKGAALAMEFSYDNSEKNPRNPNHPPARVKQGERSVDEMGNVTFTLRLAGARDKLLVREAKFRRQVEGGGDARARYNLANTLAHLGRRGEAIDEYRRALEMDPALLQARVNLGNALVAEGRVPEALTQLERAVKSDPDSQVAHNSYGLALQQSGRAADAQKEFRAARALASKEPPLTP
jgi:hypothetical protein